MKHTLALLFLTAAAALAADVKVSDLPAASTLGGTELFQVVQTSSKKATAAQVAEYANTLGAALFEAHTDKLTNFSALADAAGLFKSDGAGNYSWLGMADTGLLGDAGKVVLYGNSGQLTANNNVRVVNGTAYTQITSNGVSGSKSGNLIYVNWPGSLTGFRTITWPDASGVVHVVGQALGTPASGTLTNCTGLPVSTGISGLGTNVAAFLATPSFANFNAATTGDIGETTTSAVASGSAVSLTTATGANVTSITLTAGDWDVTGIVNVAFGSATHTGTTAGFSTTTATVPTDGSEGYTGLQLTTTSATTSVPIAAGRVSLASTTTIYLTVKSTFSAGTAAAFGKIRARRMR